MTITTTAVGFAALSLLLSAPAANAQTTQPSRQIEGAPTSISVPITRLTLKNNTVFSDTEIEQVINEVTSSYPDGTLTTEGLQEVRFRLSRLYTDHGYINSGVVIEDQKVVDGQIYLTAVEGRLTSVTVEGNKRLRDRYYQRRVTQNGREVLNVLDLRDALDLIQQDAMVRQINAELVPGVQLGESELVLRVREASPYMVTIGADNHRATSVGEHRARVSFGHRNLTRNRDNLVINLGLSEGVRDGFIGYSIPLTARDTLLSAFYSLDDAEIVEQPFDTLDIQTETQTFGIDLSHPFVRRTNSVFRVTAGFYNKSSESTLLNEPFSFNLGDVRGVGESSAIPLTFEWNQRWRNQALSARGSFRFGVDAFDSTINVDLPDSEFSAFVGQFQWVRRFGRRANELQFRTAFQLTEDPLLAIEKFPVGGARSVRGYRENQFVRDNGVVASIEMRVPLAPNPATFGPLNFRLVPFFDYGAAWDEDDRLPTSKTEEIYSVGMGLTWDPSRFFHAEVYYGEALTDVETSSDSLQSQGWHYLVNFNVPFGGSR